MKEIARSPPQHRELILNLEGKKPPPAREPGRPVNVSFAG
jgi:hypothetical protein